MAKPKQLPSAEYLRTRFNYDEATGILTWKPINAFMGWEYSWNRRCAGKIAGAISLGHYMVSLAGVGSVGAHRIIWKIIHGEDPPPMLDHKNRNPLINTLANLRPATAEQNCQNGRLRSDNTTGARGVYLHESGRYRVLITAAHKQHHIGYFATLEEAVAARKIAAEKLHGEFASHLAGDIHGASAA
jgi:hypothetical protein